MVPVGRPGIDTPAREQYISLYLKGLLEAGAPASDAKGAIMAEVLFNSPVGILSIVTVTGAIAIILVLGAVGLYKSRHPR